MRPVLLSCIVLAVAAAPALAQSRPDVPERARIRIAVISADTTGGKVKELRGTAVLHRIDADSIAFRLDRTDEILIAPWARVQQLEVSDGTRPYTFVEHLQFTALFTGLGAGIGYSSWHTCNDPESEDIWSCIVSPRRLGTSVRAGTWVGLTLGVVSMFVNREAELWRNVLRPTGPKLIFKQAARGGFQVGVSLPF